MIKVILSYIFIVGDFSVYLCNIYFGEIIEVINVCGLNGDFFLDCINVGKVVMDLSFGYQFVLNLSLNIGVNNLFDIYLDEIDMVFRLSG